jgi:hypothetical protein
MRIICLNKWFVDSHVKNFHQSWFNTSFDACVEINQSAVENVDVSIVIFGAYKVKRIVDVKSVSNEFILDVC